jgi:glycerophosphoryl diester phosphodiesterase
VTDVVAHRGASADAPENTLEAFRLAVAMGADGVELDVRRTLDGALAVHHDPALADGRVVGSLRAAELPAHVPLLDAALDACDGVAVVNIELKDLPGEPGHRDDHPLATLVVDLVTARSMADRVIVSSFDLRAVDRLRAIDPGIPTGLLALTPSDRAAAIRLVDRCAAHGHVALHPLHLGVDAELVARCHDAGVAVNTWTVDDPARMRELAAMGVDAVITNRPDVARRALGRDGADRPT